MKKYLVIFSIVFAVTTGFLYYKYITTPYAEMPVNKEINVAIATSANYNAAVYNEALAKVEIAVFKLSGTKQSIVWSKTYDNLPLQRYPELAAAFTQSIQVPDILNSKDK